MHSSAVAQRLHRLRVITGNLLKQLDWQQRMLQFSRAHLGVTIVIICGMYISAQIVFVRVLGIEATASITQLQAQQQISQQSGVQTVTQPLIAVSPITRIVIPAADINAPVLTVGLLPTPSGGEPEWNMARYAVGHHDNTGIPGQAKNIVFSSYAGNYGRIFATLDRAVPGSLITVYKGDIMYVYTVVSQQLISASAANTREHISQTAATTPANAEQVTLVASWPPSGGDRNSSYLVVVAKP